MRHEILWSWLRTPTLEVPVSLRLGCNTCLPINFAMENFGWKTCEVEKGSIILLIFSCGRAFNVGGWGLVRLILYTSLQLQIPCTYSLPTLHIYSTSNRRRVWNPVKPRWWRFSAEIVNTLTLIWMGFLGVCSQREGYNYTHCLKFVRVMLETWNLARKYTLICSFTKYTF